MIYWALLAACFLLVVSSAAIADDSTGSRAAQKLYKLNASAPNQALTDTVYRYLSDQAARAYSRKGYKDAERLYSSALDEAGRHHAKAREVAVLATNLASVYRDDGEYDKAKPLFKRALKAADDNTGGTDPVYRYVLKQYALYLSKTGRSDEARFTAESARLGYKLLPEPVAFRPLPGRFGSQLVPLLSVHPQPPFTLPVRNPNDPFWDVSQPLPVVNSNNSRPWTFHLHFAECPPRERWAAFDEEQKTSLNREWHSWLQQFRVAMDDAISHAIAPPNDGRYHLVINRFGHIDDIAVLSNPRDGEGHRQSIGGAVSRLNTSTSVPFPAQSQMEAIHIVLNFERPVEERQEPDWSQFKPEVVNGYTSVYPISGGRWKGHCCRPGFQPGSGAPSQTAYPPGVNGPGSPLAASPESPAPNLSTAFPASAATPATPGWAPPSTVYSPSATTPATPGWAPPSTVCSPSATTPATFGGTPVPALPPQLMNILQQVGLNANSGRPSSKK